MKGIKEGHKHTFVDHGVYYLCDCGKRRLKLLDSKIEGLKYGTRKDGIKLTVRDDRSRYFFPTEWEIFYKELKDKQKPVFDFLIQTGSRIDECLHTRPVDFDFDRNTVRLWKTKTKAKLNERAGKPRTIVLSNAFMKRVRKYIRNQRLDEKSENYLFFGATPGTFMTKASVFQLMKRKMFRAGIKDFYAFSLHNIRKTHGNWLKAIGVPAEEICLRLGHDFNTYLKHYGSASIFSNQDLSMIRDIFDDLYQQQRRF